MAQPPGNAPAIPPPPGVTPNFENPESLATELITVNSVFVALMLIAVGVRVWTKSRITHSLGWDDYTCVIAGIISIIHTVLVLSMLQYGSAIHLWDFPNSKFSKVLGQGLQAVGMVYGPTVFFVKLSILLLYLRIFGINKAMKILIYSTIAVQAVFYTVLFGLSIGQQLRCIGRDSITVKYCIDSSKWVLAQGIFNVISDFFVLLLPLGKIWQLKLSLRRKLGVSSIFMAGSVACLISLVRLILYAQKGHKPDVLWFAAETSILSCVEINVGIICSCTTTIPTFCRNYELKSLLTSSFGSLWSRGATTTSDSKGRNQSGSDGSGKDSGFNRFVSLSPTKGSLPHKVDSSYLELDEVSGTAPLGNLGKWKNQTDISGRQLSEEVSSEDQAERGGIVKTMDYHVARHSMENGR
ncbi:MAG: hypothetical protein M1837_003389 [Sclerophora amabilis]|nr:MAG: hypothetical protein M1837_003389 [Sclerophora amabilis]